MEIAAEHQVKEANGWNRPPGKMSNQAKLCLPFLMAVGIPLPRFLCQLPCALSPVAKQVKYLQVKLTTAETAKEGRMHSAAASLLQTLVYTHFRWRMAAIVSFKNRLWKRSVPKKTIIDTLSFKSEHITLSPCWPCLVSLMDFSELQDSHLHLKTRSLDLCMTQLFNSINQLPQAFRPLSLQRNWLRLSLFTGL